MACASARWSSCSCAATGRVRQCQRGARGEHRMAARAADGASRDSGEAHERYAARTRSPNESPFVLAADVCRIEDAYAAADAGATEIALDPFLRHPLPPVTRVSALADALAARGVTLPPAHARRSCAPRSAGASTSGSRSAHRCSRGHLGLVAELAREGRDVVADYARELLQPAHREPSFSRSARSGSCSRSS